MELGEIEDPRAMVETDVEMTDDVIFAGAKKSKMMYDRSDDGNQVSSTYKVYSVYKFDTCVCCR